MEGILQLLISLVPILLKKLVFGKVLGNTIVHFLRSFHGFSLSHEERRLATEHWLQVIVDQKVGNDVHPKNNSITVALPQEKKGKTSQSTHEISTVKLKGRKMCSK